MNSFFTTRLNGIFILNTLLELSEPVTVTELTKIINRRYFHVTAPQPMVSADTVRRFLDDFYQTTCGTDYTSFKLICFKKSSQGFVTDLNRSNITLSTYVAAYLQITPQMHFQSGAVKKRSG